MTSTPAACPSSAVRLRAVVVSVCTLAGGLMGAGDVLAAHMHSSERPALLLAQASSSVTLNEAAQMVRQRTGGRILRAETIRRDGRVTYRFRVLLDEERVRIYHVDAETGRLS